MDFLAFIAKITEFTAWPLASVAMVVLLREQVGKSLPTLRKLKAGPIEAEFEQLAEGLAVRLAHQPEAGEVIAENKNKIPAKSNRNKSAKNCP